MTSNLVHCNVLSLANIGLLIQGASGAGKSSLTLGLLEHAQQLGWEGYLVSDDQAFLEPHNNTLIAKTPDTIAGLLELRGHGIIEHPYQSSTKVRVVVQMIEDKLLDRMPEEKHIDFNGIRLPMIEVPIQHEAAAVRIVFAWLRKNVLSKKAS